MSKLAIEWNEKAERYLAPLQRDSVERGEEPRKLNGKVELHDDGTVWYHGAQFRKIIGTWNAPKAAPRRSDELDTPTTSKAEKRK